MLVIKEIGFCTTLIDNVDELTDAFIDEDLYKKNKIDLHKDTLNIALKEAKAENIPIIAVGMPIADYPKAATITEAFNMAFKEKRVAVVCTQLDSNKKRETAVFNLENSDNQNGWAAIENIEYIKGVKKRVFPNIDIKDGVICEAVSVLIGCVSLYYGMNFFERNLEENFFNPHIYDDMIYKAAVDGGNIVLKQLPTFDKKLQLDKYVIPILFKDKSDIEKKLDLLKKELDTKVTLYSISQRQILDYSKERHNDNRVVVFVAKDKKLLQGEIREFINNKQNWFRQDFVWNTLNGSYYNAFTIENRNICLLNPPGGMFARVPFYRMYRSFLELKKSVANNMIHKESKEKLINEYYFQIITIMLTKEALETIGIKYDAAIGASLGELSLPLIFNEVEVEGKGTLSYDFVMDMMYDIIGMLEKIFEIQDELCMNYFHQKTEKMEKWYLKANYEDVKKEIDKDLSRVFIIIIGSPNDVIICGEHDDCNKIINKLKCYAVKFKDLISIYVHTPILEPCRQMIEDNFLKKGLHLKKDAEVAIYNTASKRKLDNSKEMFAGTFADCIIKQINMISIYNKAYDDGYRVFLDLGSNEICSKWIRETFKEKHDVVTISLFDGKNRRDNLIRLLAQLIANKIDFDIDTFLSRVEWMEDVYTKDVSTKNINRNNSDNDKINTLIQRQIKMNNMSYEMYLSFEKMLVARLISRKNNAKTKTDKDRALYNYEQILEMTGGSMEKVLGSRYREIDKFSVRARMPLPPYLFVDRILSINAEFGKLRPGSSIEAEYDVSENCILRTSENDISTVIFSEAAHIGIFLAGYIGVDFYLKGKSKFRITDVSTEYFEKELPKIGETVQMKFVINKFVNNGNIILLFCTFEAYNKGKLIIRAQEIGGFFGQESLDVGAGIHDNKIAEKNSKSDNLFYRPITTRKSFNKEEIYNFLTGNYSKSFNVDLVDSDFHYKVCEDAVFVDRIVDMSENGGLYGLGYVVAEKDIDETFWPFKCHFKNDPILPGTIMLEGISQAAIFFQACMGLYKESKQVSYIKKNWPVKSIFRGEVKKGKHTLRYRVDIKEIKRVADGIEVIRDGKVYSDGLYIAMQENVGVIIR